MTWNEVTEFSEHLLRVVIALAAFLTAFTVVYRLAIRPVTNGAKASVKKLDQILEALPTLLQMAEDWKPNGRPGLKDTILDIEAKVAGLQNTLALRDQ